MPGTNPSSLGTETFDSLDPATGRVISTHPIHGDGDVAAAVDRARLAATWWGGLGHAYRARRLRAWKGVLARRAPELAHLVRRETGKPHGDAMLEIAIGVDLIEWAARNAARVLGPRRVRVGLLAINQAATVEYPPLGVVGVIGPWNYPVFTPMGSLAYALAAGNAVVFKPSEFTPGVGEWLARAAQEAIREQPVLQVVTGLGETGAALCRAGVDKIAFTGSTRTGKKIMAACAETLTPVLMECGGKDAMLVDADADLAAAADAAVWGSMSNAGQTCIGIERVYVHHAVYDEFLTRVQAIAGGLRPGADEGAAYGPATMPAQLEVIRGHIADALARGGRALVGGQINGPYVDPTVLIDVPADSTALTEETFGPTLVVSRVRDMDEAVDLANSSRLGLGASVFSRAHGMELARRLRVGMASVNAVLSYAFAPGLPFGGVGDSGFGRTHGEDGLREFARARSIARQRFALPLPVASFARTRRTDELLTRFIALRHGRG